MIIFAVFLISFNVARSHAASQDIIFAAKLAAKLDYCGLLLESTAITDVYDNFKKTSRLLREELNLTTFVWFSKDWSNEHADYRYQFFKVYQNSASDESGVDPSTNLEVECDNLRPKIKTAIDWALERQDWRTSNGTHRLKQYIEYKKRGALGITSFRLKSKLVALKAPY